METGDSSNTGQPAHTVPNVQNQAQNFRADPHPNVYVGGGFGAPFMQQQPVYQQPGYGVGIQNLLYQMNPNLVQQFAQQEYCPPSKDAKLKKQILNFQQFGNEDLPEAWKRFKELRRQCPKNLMTPGDFISSFYEGLTNRSKIILDTSSFGGIFTNMGPAAGEQMIDRITSNNTYWYTEGDDIPKREKTAGMFEVEEKMAMQAQLDTIQHMLKQLVQGPTQSVQAVAQPPLIPQNPYVPNPYSGPQGQGQGYGTYQQQGRDQFVPSWNNQGNQLLMNTMMAQFGKLQAENFQLFGKLQAKIDGLKAQQQGGVPEKADKKDEGVQVKDVLDDSEEEPVVQGDSIKEKAPEQDESAPSKKHERKNKKVDDSVIPYNLLPYPQRLWKSKQSDRESKFHKMLDKLEISMPFVEAITQIPSYKKFLKNILGNKKKPEKSAVVDLSEGALTCAVLQHKLPPKLKDPGSFSIPCIIGGFVVGGALFDLGASVSLMSYSLCKRLNLGTPKLTSMTLQMADRSIKRPVGVLEDVPVMIDQYFIPGDFVVIDIEEDAKVPIILGRPFLATAGALIDVRRGKLVMEVAENKIEFDIFKMAKHQPSYVDECYLIEGLGECTAESRKIELGDLHISPIDPGPPELSSVLKQKKKFSGPGGETELGREKGQNCARRSLDHGHCHGRDPGRDAEASFFHRTGQKRALGHRPPPSRDLGRDGGTRIPVLRAL
ncbi:uncharacterized protein LOC115999469 [Ipomoea triloba]|uniref:uncharacterized protein LOC115999469 n=1 Tax=Ipomoea triloba TaxID=35885 RepID=UPI00125DA7FB|nr:uncharacterized protein LOC115999469 [Ipomoea triloba]